MLGHLPYGSKRQSSLNCYPPTSIKPLPAFLNHSLSALTFYCLPAVGKCYTLKESKDTKKSSKGPFVQLQQFKPPSLMLEQVCIFCRFHLNSSSRATLHSMFKKNVLKDGMSSSFCGVVGLILFPVEPFPPTGLHSIVAHNLSIWCM